MVISQLKLSEMQIQWPLLLQEIWVAESWFSIVFCLVVFFPPQGRTSKKKIWQLSRVWENESHVSYIPTQSTRHDEDWTLLCCTSFLHQNVLSRRQPWCYPSVTSVELHLRRCLADNLTLISNNIRGHFHYSTVHAAPSKHPTTWSMTPCVTLSLHADTPWGCWYQSILRQHGQTTLRFT